jgi:hypothetical protein
VRYIEAGGGRRVGHGLPFFTSHMSAPKPMKASLAIPGEVLQSVGIDAGQIQVLVPPGADQPDIVILRRSRRIRNSGVADPSLRSG